MEKTRSWGERVLRAIIVTATIVVFIGTIAILLTHTASWAFYMAVGGLAVGVIACIVFTEIYGLMNDPAAGSRTHHELTTCGRCGFHQPPPTRRIKEGSQETQYIYPNRCFHCGAPLKQSSPPDKSIEPPEPRRVTEGYDPDEIKKR